MKGLFATDPEIYKVLIDEVNRGRSGLEMIASENYVSKAVLQATGSVLTNKYSEGYPKKRYYAGNEFIDVAEILAIERAKELFRADFVNVQSHSGTTANMEAYFALINLGDPILSMSLDHGGHLSHGHKVNFSGKFYTIHSYEVDPLTHRIDMDEVRSRAHDVKPKLIVAGFSAYSRVLDFEAFQEIANEVGAYLVSDIAHIAGLVVAGEHPDPVPYSDLVTTTTHKTLRGPRGAIIMGREEHETSVNRAVFPGMQGGPFDHIIAAKAVAFKEALQPDFKVYAKKIISNAKSLAESLMEYGANVITNGTDNHLVLLDLTTFNLGGKIAETTLDSVGIFTNKNMIPFDTRSPFDPSGLRLGTPALTTRGMGVIEMKEIGELVVKTLTNIEDVSKLEQIKSSVKSICDEYPLYPEFEILR